MKCEKAIQNVDKYFSEWGGELDSETSYHLSSCQNCHLHFLACEKAHGLITKIRDFEPELSDPSGLTDDIMGRLPEAKNEKKVGHMAIFQNAIFRWSLSAAAIILFALFGYEQFVVLDKINRLETQFQNVSEKKSGHKNKRTYKAWEIRAIKNFSSIRADKKGLLEKFNSVANNI